MRSRLFPVVLLLASCSPEEPGEPLVAAPAVTGRAITARSPEGAPRFLWDGTHRPSSLAAPDAARAHLVRHRAAYAVDDAALDTAVVLRTVTTRAGATVTSFRQVIGGVPVLGSDTHVLLRADRSLVAISGGPHPAAVAGFRAVLARHLEGAAGDALVAVTGAAGQLTPAGDEGGWRRFALAHPTHTASDAIRARTVYFTQGERLRPAHEVELLLARTGSSDVRGVRVVVADDDGSLLDRRELTVSDSFSYRVWADGAKRPLDGPTVDATPHPTGTPDGVQPALIGPSLIAMESFNTPPGGAVDPWLPAGATVSSGNNVDAYSDRVAPDGFTAGSDLRATTTSAGVFDRTFDPGQSPLASSNQTMAAIIQAFYVANWLHDDWYDSGFDEAAGNAQLNNYGRGGAGNDAMKLEIQDNADTERDNANMLTPADGTAPRMQIYLWSALENRRVQVASAGLDYLAGSAQFGPQTFDLTDTMRVASPADACTNVSNTVSGHIAIITRGTCDFIDKTRRAASAGAVGVILVDNVASVTPPQLGGSGGQPITIPTLSVTQAAGAELIARASGATTTRLWRQGGILREGAIDTSLVAHEWGHYLHHRMVGGCSNEQCAAISEGWGDFVALHTMMEDGDAAAGTYGVAVWAGGSNVNAPYFGIRRTPYTTDTAKNPLTFRHIGDGQTLPALALGYNGGGDNSEVHNAGEIWSQMMFQGYARLLANRGGRSFAEVRRAMADYVVAGLAMTPPDATFLEQRDAVVAAAFAVSPADASQIALGFADRGAGSCAVGPPRTSVTFDGVVESFTVAPVATIGAVWADDSIGSCDDDDLLDAQERGRMRIEVQNTGAADLTDAQLLVATTTAGVTFPAGATVPVGTVAPGTTVVAGVETLLAPSFPQRGNIALTITLTSGQTCVASLQTSVSVAANRDDIPASSTLDTFESRTDAFTATGTNASRVWSRIAESPTQHLWRGKALAQVTDTQLVSPTLNVGTGPFTLTFKHRHKFEVSQGKNWDGGVVEVSQDGGASWADASTLGTIGYDGPIETGAGNPLAGRQAFVKTSAGFPALATETVTFGTNLQGKSVKIRFRLGTDQAVAAADHAWDIDDVQATGITNTPFPSVVDDAAVCHAPVANAGPDQNVLTGALVTLDASGSTDQNGDPLTFTWSQLSGPTATLSATNVAKPTFTAPAGTMVFQVVVSDGYLSSSDTVTITASSTPAPDAALPDAAIADAAVPDAAVPDAALPDAAVPDANLPDAAVPDAAIPDAAPPDMPDADLPDAAPAPDAASTPDARPAPDASGPPPSGDDGCSCRVAPRGGAPAWPALSLLSAVFLALVRRRR